jgi:NADH-quinone oxidoreductase subunit L
VTTATGAFSLLWLVIALPLLGALVLLVGGRRTDGWGHLLATAQPVASFLIGTVLFFGMLGKPADARSISQHLFSWIPVAGFNVDAGLLVDPLSISFLLLITGVGSLIHIYSIGYMEHDADRRRFFGYLNLFLASMLLLVLSDSYLALYVGWEGVGLASYLLIGFWNYKPEYATAAKKAFVMNRVGDFGLSVAIMVMFATFGTVSIAGVAAGAPAASRGTLNLIGLLLLLAACGKSAQVPLQAWLGDAMAGPTPVSALIHAATMVTAGVYLVARSHALFDLAPGAQTAVAVVGAVTLLFGAVVGAAKDDIKKSLAGSTMSQIGYMVLAVGLGPIGYVFGIAHLLTHGFFKANLFLSAGSVMHGMDDEVNMRRFGGLRKLLPVTFVTFGLGYLAIIGIPPFSGFFTKDSIIDAAWEKGGTSGWILAACAIIGAGITAFYMSRVMLMTYFGPKRWEENGVIGGAGAHPPFTEAERHIPHPHESPLLMTVPMILLAIGSVGAGWFLIVNSRFADFLAPVVGLPPDQHGIWTWPGIIALILAVFGVGIAWAMYGRVPVLATAPRGTAATRAARADLYGDAFNESVLMRPGQWLTRLSVYFDSRGVDGLVNGLAATIGGTSGRMRKLQTGFVRSYALSMLIGAVLLVAGLLVVRL